MDLKRLSIACLCIVFTNLLHSQTIEHPNYSLKSHETLDLRRIVISGNSTNLHFSIENRIEGGFFCADKNIFVVYPDGTRSKLKSSNGIPVCPDRYKFKTIGERLDFVLTFPVLKTGTGSIDLIEDCSENCFSFYGIILDKNLNLKIEEAFGFAEKKEPVNAMLSFIRIAEEKEGTSQGVDGLLYINIIKLADETGNADIAAEWYNKLKISGIKEVWQYIKLLKDQGIKY